MIVVLALRGLVSRRGGTLIIPCAIRVTSRGIRDSRVLCVIELIEPMLIGKWCSAQCAESKILVIF